MRGVGVGRMPIVGVLGSSCVLFRCDYINFGCGYPAACHFAHFETCADSKRGCCFRKGIEGDAGVYESAEHHVAAYSGKTF